MIRKVLTMAAAILCLSACSGNKTEAATNPESTPDKLAQTMTPDTTSAKVQVSTTMGDFTILLYGDTPKHRDNFLKLVSENFYDSLLFHRVIKDFMVQAGDPTSKNAAPGAMLGGGDPGYTIEAEIVYPKHYHKRGALAAARTGDNVNPERRSSGSQFYVVTGNTYSADMLKQMQGQQIFNKLVEENMDQVRQLQQAGDRQGLYDLQVKLEAETDARLEKGETIMTQQMVDEYTTIGGAPHLDGQYTVFGEVIDGMDTIDKIEGAATGAADRPVDDIRILSMKVIK